MKKRLLFFLYSVAILLSSNSEAQINRRNLKKSVAYKANYQRMVSGFNSEQCFEIKQGTLLAWGANGNGQLGDGTTTQRKTPVQIGNKTNWVFIAPGGYHTIGILSDGTLWAWGNNNNGQIGDGTTTQRNAPKQIGTDNKWISAAGGSFYSMAIKSDGTLWAWGRNDYGQLGDGTVTDKSSPTQIGTDNKWVQISCGFSHTLGLKSDGTLWIWGNNFNGQLGDGTTTDQHGPKQIGTDNKWVTIYAGNTSSFAIKSDGTLWAWGYNGNNELGDGTTTQRNNPIQITSDTKWVSITSGGNGGMGLKSDGSIWNWGDNSNGQLGDGTTTKSSTPAQMGTDKNWVYISSSSAGGMALKANGEIWVWGRNNAGQIGDGTATDRLSPFQLATDRSQWITLSGGYNHSHALKSDGTLWAWGDNGNGQLGNGNTSVVATPVQIGTDNKWISVSSGGYHTLALKADGTLWANGDNGFGQIGDGTTTQRNSPVKVGTDNKWASIAAGYNHSLCLKTDGTLWAWGANASGDLGDGTTTDRHTPLQIGTDNKWVSIAAGVAHSIGIKSDGTLWAWGSNSNGQIGNGSNTDQRSPVQIGTDTKWVGIAVGNYHSFGIKSNGTLWAWGYNQSGQLGDGTTTERTSPVQIGTDNKWVSIQADGHHTIGLKTDGTLFCWGDNGNGDVGDGSTTQRNSPVQISGTTWVSISAGAYHSMALKVDRTQFCATGYNGHGELGDGTTTDKNTFTCVAMPNSSQACPIPSASDVTICSGNSTTLNATSDGTISWYSASTNGTYLAAGGSYNTSVLFSDTTFYAQDTTCPAAPRKAVRVTIITLPISANASTTTICEGSSVTLTGTSTSLSVPINYSWSDGVNNGVSFIPSTSKTYTVTGTDANSCSGNATITIQVNPSPMVSANASTNTICSGTSTTLTGSGALSYSWSDGVNDGISFIPSATKTYTVIGTDANSCSDTDTITIHVNPSPTVSANSSVTSVCSGASVILTGTSTAIGSQINYSWSDGINDGVSFMPSGTKTYTVTGIDTKNCSDTDTITIYVNNTSGTSITANASATTICIGTSVTLTGASTPPSAQINYSWSDGVNDGVSFIPGSTKTYTVTGINTSNCSNTASITIYVNSLPVVSANASALSVCAGASAVLFGTSTPLSAQINYNWSGGVNDGVSFVPSATKTYTVTGTDANGCLDTDTITIHVNNLSGASVSANASALTLCAGASTTLFGTSTPLSAQINYTWSDGVNDGVSFFPSSTKTYTVAGNNTNNCSNTATIKIYVNALPTVTAHASLTTVCSGASTKLFGTSTPLSGQGANSYSWSDGVNDAVSFVPTTSKTYTLTGTDANNCSDSDTISIHVLTSAPFTVNANANINMLCAGASLILVGTSNPFNAPINYSWSNGINDGVSFVPSATTTYTITGMDTKGCSDTDTIRVTVLNPPNVIAHASHTTICEGDSIYLSSEGNALSFSWVGNMKDSLNFAPANTQTYTLTGTAQNGCSTSNAVTVVVFSLPLVGVSGLASKTLICSGDSVILEGSGADKYYWSGGIKDRKAFYPLSTSTFTLTGITNNTCDNTTSITIQVNKSPVVNPVVNPSSAAVCKGSPVTLYGTCTALNAQMNYVWSDSVTDGIPFIPLASHTYTVIGTDANNNCSGTALRAISVFFLPDVGITASPSVTICLGDSVLLKGTGANTYDWSDNVMDSVSFSPQATTTYYVTGKDQYSCADTASQLIIVDSTCKEIIGVGIIESANNSIKINIYPNPNNGEFTITGTSDGTYAIINDLGQNVQEFKLNSTNQYSITIEKLNSGIYFMVGLNNTMLTRQKIVIIN